jgi:hypothetical protein
MTKKRVNDIRKQLLGVTLALTTIKGQAKQI